MFEETSKVKKTRTRSGALVILDQIDAFLEHGINSEAQHAELVGLLDDLDSVVAALSGRLQTKVIHGAEEPRFPKAATFARAQSEQSGPLDETKPDLAALLVRIRARLHQFDPISLLRVLMHNGVSRRNIEFRSHHSKAAKVDSCRTLSWFAMA